MSYQQSSIDDLIAVVNSTNAINLVKTDLILSTPQVVSGSWQEGLTEKNTAIRLTAKPEASYQGTQQVVYDRLNLASLANIPGVKVVANTPVSTYDVLNGFTYFTGIQLSTDDVEDLPVDTSGATPKIVFSAKPASVGWVGSVAFDVIPGGIAIDDEITDPDLPGLNYPTANPGTDVMGPVYMYGYDFTAFQPDIGDIVPGVLSTADAAALVVALNNIDVSAGKGLWVSASANTQYNLTNATVVTNELNSPSLPTNPNYKYVLVLELEGTVTIPTGTLYFHYNDPFDPEDF